LIRALKRRQHKDIRWPSPSTFKMLFSYSDHEAVEVEDYSDNEEEPEQM